MINISIPLILGSKQRYKEIYEQLSVIAPTLFVESLRVSWQDNFRLHAEALGKSTEAEELLNEYDAHVAEVQAALGDKIVDTTVSIIRFRPGQVRLYLFCAGPLVALPNLLAGEQSHRTTSLPT